MTYEEVCEKASKAVNRLKLVELTKDMTFVQALPAHIDYITIGIYLQTNK